MDIHINNHAGGIIQQTDKPIINVFSNTAEKKSSYQDVAEDVEAEDVEPTEDPPVVTEIPEGETNDIMTGITKPIPPVADILNTDEAKELKKKLIAAGMLTDDWQPVGLTSTEKGQLAMKISEKLDISNKWQLFGGLWNVKPETLRSYYNEAFNQKKNLAFQERLKKILS